MEEGEKEGSGVEIHQTNQEPLKFCFVQPEQARQNWVDLHSETHKESLFLPSKQKPCFLFFVDEALNEATVFLELPKNISIWLCVGVTVYVQWEWS